MWKLILSAVMTMAVGCSAAPGPAEPAAVFENNLEKLSPGDLPDGFLIIDGGFTVKEVEGNKVIELPGDPLDTFGVMFGPSQKDGLVVSARMKSATKGRRAPAFGVSLSGAGGYRLQYSGNKKALEIYRADESQTSVPFTWESGTWLRLKLQVRKVGEGKWLAEGKAWKDGTAEPAEWLIKLDVAEEPPSGRPAIWGNPFSGEAIQFDDLKVTPVAS
jgi:hypothetical protein